MLAKNYSLFFADFIFRKRILFLLLYIDIIYYYDVNKKQNRVFPSLMTYINVIYYYFDILQLGIEWNKMKNSYHEF